MSKEANPRVREIIREMCAGNSSLAAATLAEEFIIIPKEDLPAIELCGCSDDGLFMKGDCWEKGMGNTPADVAWSEALEHLAHWHFVASGKAAEVRAVESRNKRRDELARDIHSKVYGSMSANPGYANSNNALQEAIDRIIELESAA